MSSIFLQCLLGMQCNDFAMIAADQIDTHNIVIMKNDKNKIFQLSKCMMMGVSGDAADSSQFTQFIDKNIRLYKLRNNYDLNTNACVHFVRQNILDGLMKGVPYILNLLIGGYDKESGGQLYYLDFLSTCVRVPFATQGLCGTLTLGILDRFYRPDLTEGEAYNIMIMCVQEIHQRFLISLPSFQVSVVNEDGVQNLPVITPFKAD